MTPKEGRQLQDMFAAIRLQLDILERMYDPKLVHNLEENNALNKTKLNEYIAEVESTDETKKD